MSCSAILRQSDRESCDDEEEGGGGGVDLEDAKRGWAKREESLADERRREVEREEAEDKNEEEKRREEEENREEIIGDDVQGLVALQLRRCVRPGVKKKNGRREHRQTDRVCFPWLGEKGNGKGEKKSARASTGC